MALPLLLRCERGGSAAGWWCAKQASMVAQGWKMVELWWPEVCALRMKVEDGSDVDLWWWRG